MTPETDDVLLDLARIFEKHGVEGSFAIVGEKARVLKRRGRADVIEAFKAPRRSLPVKPPLRPPNHRGIPERLGLASRC